MSPHAGSRPRLQAEAFPRSVVMRTRGHARGVSLKLAISRIWSRFGAFNSWPAWRRLGKLVAAAAMLFAVGVAAATADRSIAHARRQAGAPAVSRSVVIDHHRLALVIGNSNYPDADAPLVQPVNDARAMAVALRKQGFSVELVTNGRRDDMSDAIAHLMANIRSDSTVLVFFSGYAVQSDGENYLIPVDAKIWFEDDVQRDGVGLNGVLSELRQSGARVRVAIVDASRRNPYERRFRDYSHGLAPIETRTNEIALSAAGSDQVADDTGGPHDVLVSELLDSASSSPANIEDLFDRTRRGVARVTGDQQVPIVSSALTEELKLDVGRAEAAPSS
jgi:uncharacterized caspase-like protein